MLSDRTRRSPNTTSADCKLSMRARKPKIGELAYCKTCAENAGSLEISATNSRISTSSRANKSSNRSTKGGKAGQQTFAVGLARFCHTRVHFPSYRQILDL